ncbi:MAG: hypothetical protein NVS3B26_11440 [Mycobacteriales bacterium]
MLPQAPTELLIHAVDGLLATRSVELAPTQALERLGTVLTEGERLAAVALDGMADLDNRELFVLDDAGSAAGWLRTRRTGGDPRRLALARRLAYHPHVREALVHGEIDVAIADKVCSALSYTPLEADEERLDAVVSDGARQVLQEVCGGRVTPGDTAQLDQLIEAALADTSSAPVNRLEPIFVFLASRIVPAVLSRTLRDLAEALVLPSFNEEPADDEWLDLQQVLDGRWHVAGYLDAETGSVLNAELDRRMATDTVEDSSDNAEPVGRARNRGQRRAAALRSLAADGRAHDGAGADRASADISIVVRQETIVGLPGGLPARLSDGTRIGLEAMRRLGCFGRIGAVILDAAGRPVGASGSHRNATPRERRALEAQWGGCAVDGCNQPFSRTSPHHVIPWWLSGRTCLADLVPACQHHHHDIHDGQRTLRLRDGRRITPTGWADDG